MSVYTTGLLWVGGAAVFASLLAYVIRKYGPDEGRSENNEAAGQVFTIVGGLQAVLVAFVLIALFDGVAAAGNASYEEADSLVAATWAGDALGERTGDEVRRLSREYLETVVDEEWPRMRSGDESDDAGWSTLDRLRRVIAEAPATDAWLVDRKTEAADKLWQVYQARQTRLDSATEGVDAVVWFVLVMGGILTIGLPLLFGGPLMRTHVIIVATLAATITLLLYATYQLQNPFGGGAELQPDAFSAALSRL
ncbi:DUF4239 domain-containing protein [Saccharothrix violaceirubra]|uniref:DUF4239 domain-containing protein n=1 Tax=Saccharothrix violaceirubra TaxID=413306 RepID=A0A7W7T625_9PSEU|nr:hypothetical protein [Saccharothrix violaceirubra]MBB4967210.1 hypothetical protein [Saccharothrix violaceirubra]